MPSGLGAAAKLSMFQEEFQPGASQGEDMVGKVKAIADLFEWPNWMSHVIFKAYESDYYKVSDGVTCPFGIEFGAQHLKLLKSPVGVGHDLLYYLTYAQRKTYGFPLKKWHTDLWFKKSLIEFGVDDFRAMVSYKVLINLGFYAYGKHRIRSHREPGYGEFKYIPTLVKRFEKDGST